MKGIAIILSFCMLLLSTGNLLEHYQVPAESVEMTCCTDCSSGCCDADMDHQESKEPCEREQDCPPGCDCSCQFQITAIGYSFMELAGVMVQSYHYGQYVNTYSFEYSDDFLQPPRFG